MMSLAQPATSPRAFTSYHMRVIALALIEAWNRLPTEKLPRHLPFDPSMYSNEDQLTSRMHAVLNIMLSEPSSTAFSSKYFQDVHRDSKSPNHDGTREDLMPDLTVALLALPTHLPAGSIRSNLALRIEAKVFEGQRGLHKYLREGVQRFVNGDYAPDTDIGMMLVYSSKLLKLPDDLSKYLRKKTATCAATRWGGRVDVLGPYMSHPVGVTVHRREFNAASAHDFELHHLWLSSPTVIARLARSLARTKKSLAPVV